MGDKHCVLDDSFACCLPIMYCPLSLELARFACKVSLRALLAKFRYALGSSENSPFNSPYNTI